MKKLDQLVNIVTGNIFNENIAWSGGLDPKLTMPFVIHQDTPTNQKPIRMSLVFYSFDSKHWEDQKY